MTDRISLKNIGKTAGCVVALVFVLRNASLSEFTNDYFAGWHTYRIGAAALLAATVLASLGVGAVEIQPLQAVSLVLAKLGFPPLVGADPRRERGLSAIRSRRTVSGGLAGGGAAGRPAGSSAPDMSPLPPACRPAPESPGSCRSPA